MKMKKQSIILKALEISPENSEALKYFSDFLVSIQRYSEAKALLEKCLILVQETRCFQLTRSSL